MRVRGTEEIWRGSKDCRGAGCLPLEAPQTAEMDEDLMKNDELDSNNISGSCCVMKKQRDRPGSSGVQGANVRRVEVQRR